MQAQARSMQAPGARFRPLEARPLRAQIGGASSRRSTIARDAGTAGSSDLTERRGQVQAWISNWQSRSSVVAHSAGAAAAASSGDLPERRAQVQAWISNWQARSSVVPAAGAGAAAPAPSADGGLAAVVKGYLHLWTALGSLYVVDTVIKSALLSAGIKFPGPLVGMFLVFGILCAVGDKAADATLKFYEPALAWIARWLPLFYIASLVTLPLAVQGIPMADLSKLLSILCVGTVATLLFTAFVTVWIREAVKTPVKEIAKAKPSEAFSVGHYAFWGAVAGLSLAVTVINPAMGVDAALPFNLAATVGGYLIGSAVPKGLQAIFHPVVVTALIANAGAALHGALRGIDYNAALKTYYSKGYGPMGAGDLLMSLLGIVIISFGFRVYTQRDTMKRHAPEILGACLLSSIFSLFSTAFAAKALALDPLLSRAVCPRSVTVALAMPIAAQLDAPLSITAACVLLQGILGANFGPGLMTALGVKDTIARGLAAAGTSGGLGTAALCAREPEALPFCALSYSMVGIMSTVLIALPAVRAILIGITG